MFNIFLFWMRLKLCAVMLQVQKDLIKVLETNVINRQDACKTLRFVYLL